MGYFIETDSKGKSLGRYFEEKIDALSRDGAEEVSGTEFCENLICVVNNTHFAAVGYMCDQRELDRASGPDGRERKWFIYPHAKVLSGFEKPKRKSLWKYLKSMF